MLILKLFLGYFTLISLNIDHFKPFRTKKSKRYNKIALRFALLFSCIIYINSLQQVFYTQIGVAL